MMRVANRRFGLLIWIQPNLVRSILGEMEFQVCSNGGPRPFPGEDSIKIVKIYQCPMKILTNWHRQSLGNDNSSFFKYRAKLSSKGKYRSLVKIHWQRKNKFLGQFLLNTDFSGKDIQFSLEIKDHAFLKIYILFSLKLLTHALI